MALNTRCPQCGTAFKVVADQLRVRGGLVRCGVCATVFDGNACLVGGQTQPAYPAFTPAPTAPTVPAAPTAPTTPTAPAAPAAPVAPAPFDSYSSSQRYPVPPVEWPPRDPAPVNPIGAAPRPPAPGNVAEPAEGTSSYYAEPSVLRARDGIRHDAREATPALTPFDDTEDHSIGAAPQAQSAPSYPEIRQPRASEAGARRVDPPALRTRSEPGFGDPRPVPDWRSAGAPSLSEALIESDLDDDDALRIGDLPYDAVHGEPRFHIDGDTPERVPAAPYFEEERPRRVAIMTWIWTALCLAGLVLLAVQVVYVYRNDIVTRFPFLRPALEAGCAHLQCRVDYERRIDRISVVSSSLRPPPGLPPSDGHSKFVFRAVIRNRFDNPQPYPALVLELTDFSDTVVARKVLPPDVYVPAAQRNQPFGAGADVNIAIPIDVTGLSVNGYQLDKFFP